MDLDKVNFSQQEIHRGGLQMSPDLLQTHHDLWWRHEAVDLLPARPECGRTGERLPQCQLGLCPLPGQGGLPEVGPAAHLGGGGRHHEAVRGLASDAGPDSSVPGRAGLPGEGRPGLAGSCGVFSPPRGSQDNLHLHAPEQFPAPLH